MAQAPQEDRKRLLFVCSGNTCRSPLAMIVAMSQVGDRADCDSAAGKFASGKFKSGKFTASKGKMAIQKKYGDQSNEYDHISHYVPKPLSIELVVWATDILFLGREFMENAKTHFPMEYHDKMKFYGTYDNNRAITMHEVPDPMDGDWWPDYYGLPRPPPAQQENYDTVLDSMIDDFQPKLTAVLWP